MFLRLTLLASKAYDKIRMIIHPENKKLKLPSGGILWLGEIVQTGADADAENADAAGDAITTRVQCLELPSIEDGTMIADAGKPVHLVITCL